MLKYVPSINKCDDSVLLILNDGGLSRYASNFLFNVDILCPLSFEIYLRVCLSITHFSNHTCSFLDFTPSFLFVNNRLQKLHLYRCFPFCFPHFIVSNPSHDQHLFFYSFYLIFIFIETSFNKYNVSRCISLICGAFTNYF